jgi:PAS domain S-box-containing protein
MPTDPSSRDNAPHGAGERRFVDELEELLVTGDAGVVATDLDGVITHWTAGAERLYGWTAAEAIGQPVLTLLVAPDNRSLAQANLDTIRSTGNGEGKFDLQTKDGGIVAAYVCGTLIKDDAGRSVGVLGLSMDVDA